MIIHPDVLAAHAQFGGDLESMQMLYEHPDLKAEIARLRAENATLRAERDEARLSAQTIGDQLGIEIDRLQRALLDKRKQVLEEAAKIADGAAEGRRRQVSEKRAANLKSEARDYESMMIEAVHIATAIRALAQEDKT